MALVKQAEEKLDQAINLDPTEPLAAAEVYLAAIRLLQQAKRESQGDISRLNRLERSARERFDDCEKRVQNQKAPADRQRDQQQDGNANASLKGWGIKGVLESVGGWFTKSDPMPITRKQQAPPKGVGTGNSQNVLRDPVPAKNVQPRKQTPPPPPISSALRGVDRQLAASILNDVVDKSPGIKFDDIAGLAVVKAALQEAVILPSQRPDLFTGIRAPPRGILLFGPPGTGKTLLAKAVATESDCRFFSISASSITSKWVGQGEKMVKALFSVAAELSPSIIFIDEVDSILGARSDGEHDASRRIKTEFLVQFDGVHSATSPQSRIVVIAATNRPQELDEAVRRRFTKRLLVPLPELATRMQVIGRLLEGQSTCLSDADMRRVGDLTAGYSGSDLAAVCKEAAMAPLRELGPRLQEARASEVRPVRYRDLEAAVSMMRPSVSRDLVEQLRAWDAEYGSYAAIQ